MPSQSLKIEYIFINKEFPFRINLVKLKALLKKHPEITKNLHTCKNIKME